MNIRYNYLIIHPTTEPSIQKKNMNFSDDGSARKKRKNGCITIKMNSKIPLLIIKNKNDLILVYSSVYFQRNIFHYRYFFIHKITPPFSLGGTACTETTSISGWSFNFFYFSDEIYFLKK